MTSIAFDPSLWTGRGLNWPEVHFEPAHCGCPATLTFGLMQIDFHRHLLRPGAWRRAPGWWGFAFLNIIIEVG